MVAKLKKGDRVEIKPADGGWSGNIGVTFSYGMRRKKAPQHIVFYHNTTIPTYTTEVRLWIRRRL